MRVALDTRWIPSEASGVGVYARELAARLPGLDPSSEFLFYFKDRAVRDRLLAGPLGGRRNVIPVTVPYGVYSPIGQLRLARDLRARGVDLYHSPSYLFPMPAFPAGRTGRIRLVVTLHDVIPLVQPRSVARSWKRRLLPLYARLHKEAVRRADRVLCVSNAARGDVISRLRIPASEEGRLRTVYNGVSERFLDAVRLPRDPGRVATILAVGRSEPYKNLSGLVRAFARVRARVTDRVRLLIAGTPDPRYPEPMEEAKAAGVADHIEWSGYLSDEKLLEAYLGADALVHASRLEGFGLPVLEAMACGLPVVCANVSALPEVAGDAAILVDPDDPDKMADAIGRVLTDPDLAADLARRGRTRAAEFTWDRTALETLAVYREVSAPGTC
jgi:glycosyltransferase involved in cell wall biosynthesis